MNGELSVTAAEQMNALLYAVAAGFAMGVFYDVFRAVRVFFKCGKIAVIIHDLIFWFVSAVCVFFTSISVNGGYVRIYFVAAVLLSWVLYFFTLGHLTMFMVNIAALGIKWLGTACFKYLITPVGRLSERFFMLITQKTAGLFMQMTKIRKKHKKC